MARLMFTCQPIYVVPLECGKSLNISCFFHLRQVNQQFRASNADIFWPFGIHQLKAQSGRNKALFIIYIYIILHHLNNYITSKSILQFLPEKEKMEEHMKTNGLFK